MEPPVAQECDKTQSDAGKKNQNAIQESGTASRGNEAQNNAAKEVAPKEPQPASQ